MKSVHSNTSGRVRRLCDSRTSMHKPTIGMQWLYTLSSAKLDYSLREKFTWWTRGNIVGDWLSRSLAFCLSMHFYGCYFERNHFIEEEIRRPWKLITMGNTRTRRQNGYFKGTRKKAAVNKNKKWDWIFTSLPMKTWSFQLCTEGLKQAISSCWRRMNWQINIDQFLTVINIYTWSHQHILEILHWIPGSHEPGVTVWWVPKIVAPTCMCTWMDRHVSVRNPNIGKRGTNMWNRSNAKQCKKLSIFSLLWQIILTSLYIVLLTVATK